MPTVRIVPPRVHFHHKSHSLPIFSQTHHNGENFVIYLCEEVNKS